jgi:hypothetical protein
MTCNLGKLELVEKMVDGGLEVYWGPYVMLCLSSLYLKICRCFLLYCLPPPVTNSFLTINSHGFVIYHRIPKSIILKLSWDFQSLGALLCRDFSPDHLFNLRGSEDLLFFSIHALIYAEGTSNSIGHTFFLLLSRYADVTLPISLWIFF